MRRKFFLLWLAALFIAAAAHGQDLAKTKVTIFCDENYPPYSYGVNGVAKGIYVDILKTAFSRMPGYSVTIEPVPWKRALDSARRGDVVAIFPPYCSATDRPWLDCAVALYEEELVVFGKLSVIETRAKWPADYKGLRVGINTGFYLVIPEADRASVVIDEALDSKVNIKRLLNGFIDVYVNDRFSILSTLKEMKDSGEYKPDGPSRIVAGPVLSRKLAYLGFTNADAGKFQFKTDFRKELTRIVNDMKSAGEIRKIIDAWLVGLK